MPLSPEEVAIIKATAPVVKKHGVAITTTMYKSLMEGNPDLKNLFNQTNQKNGQQQAALANALYAYAVNIDNLGALSPAVERICQKHASLFIRPDQYTTVGTYLIAAMGTVLGDALTPDILAAWTAAYWQLAKIMIGREETLYQETPDWKDWRDFKIAKKIPESSSITSFYLEPVDGQPLPSFKPGQYISVQTYLPGVKIMQSRQYSLSTDSNSKYYRISVKREDALQLPGSTQKVSPGEISNALHASKNEGETIQVSPPHGEFFLDTSTIESASPVILLSAGVGLTPLVSILNTLTSQKSDRPISWIHATRNKSVQAFDAHVRFVAAEHPNVLTQLFVKSPAADERRGVDYDFDGRLDLAVLTDEELHIKNSATKYFICGPTEFMLDTRRKLQSLGVETKRIELEMFGTGGDMLDA